MTRSIAMQLNKIPFSRPSETLLYGVLSLCAVLGVVTTFGIVLVLMIESSGFFNNIPLYEFLFGTQWSPLIEPKTFGVLPLVSGTLLVAVMASCVSMPLGLLIAIYMAEFASKSIRMVLKPFLELLAGIPSVVFGFFALSAVTPTLTRIFPNIDVFNALSAAIVVGIMTIPLVASISDDAIRSVSRSLREGGYALGATNFEVIRFIVLAVFECL